MAHLLLLLTTLFASRVPYPPLLQKLKASGGDAAKIIRVHDWRNLAKLARGKRYKFVLDERGTLLIAPLPADAPNNEYVHPILAGGEKVRTAGGITVEGKQVTLDQDSKAYCPTLESLDEAATLLKKLGFAVVKKDQPPKCK